MKPLTLRVIKDEHRALAAMLRTLASRGLIILETNRTNLGFVRTVNKGLRLHRQRDVVILNSDTEVYNDWLDRLLGHARAYPRLGSITPLSNNATICSYPETLGGNLYSIASLDPYIPNARSDNAVGYTGTFNGFTVGATYSFGRDAVNGAGPAATNCPGESADSKACRQYTAMLKYDSPSFGAAMSIDRMNGGPSATLGLNSSDYTDQRVVVSGYAQAGIVKLTAGLVHRTRQLAQIAGRQQSPQHRHEDRVLPGQMTALRQRERRQWAEWQ